MPFKRPGSPCYYASAIVDGKQIRRSTGTTDKKTAAKIEKDWRENLKTTGNQWENMISAYLADKPSERAAYCIQALKPHFQGRQADSITTLDIKRYNQARRKEGISDATIRRELTVMRAAFNHARDELGWIIPPFPAKSMPNKPSSRVRWLTQSEYLKLYSIALGNKRAPYLAPFINIAVNTGMRKNEMLKLKWSRIDMERREIYLMPADQKNKSYDVVPLNNSAVAAIKALKNNTEWVFQKKGERLQDVRGSFKMACKKAGITDFRIHDLRHTCAAWLVQAGHSLPVVGQLLRHKDVTTTAIYAHLAPESARAAVDSLNIN